VNARTVVAAAVNLAGFALLAQRAAISVQHSGPTLTPANVLTLSRVGAAALLCGYAALPRQRRSRTIAWLALLWGATVTDWLDGPVARRARPTRLGAVLDLEADSWLTLWAAVAAWRAGALPAICMAAPTWRYVVRWRRGVAMPMATAAWQRAAGATQMAVFAGALAPNRRLRSLARAVFPVASIAQLAALAADLVSLAPAPADAATERLSAPPIRA
jgi:phosphatidylglycerophosphate synthase